MNQLEAGREMEGPVFVGMDVRLRSSHTASRFNAEAQRGKGQRRFKKWDFRFILNHWQMSEAF